MDDQILSLEHISLSYHTMKGETPALCDLTFSVTPGEFVALVGPSGCGKSTILNLISGLLKPEAGTLLSRGRPITEADLHIGYMLQRDHLFEWRTIYSNVLLGLEISRTLTPERKEKVGEMMETYGLKSFSNARPSELSGGMRQRAALIRTLAMEPDLLLLDEPFSALDYQTRLNVCDDIGKIIKKEGKTAILVTHDISEAISMADRVIVLAARPAYVKKKIPIRFAMEERTPMKARSAPEFKTYFNAIWKELNENAQAKTPESSFQRAYLRQKKREREQVRVFRALLLVSFLVLWEVAADLRWIDPFIFSSPVRVGKTFVTLLTEQNLLRHIGITVYETGISFLLVSALGMAFAVLLWLFPRFSAVMEPYLVVLNSLPKSALAPLLIVWMGANVKTIITAGISVAIFGSVISIYSSFQSVEPDMLRLIATLGGTKKDMLFRVVLPWSFPGLLAVWKVNIGLCLVGVVIGEFIGAREGLGYLIIYGSQVFRYAHAREGRMTDDWNRMSGRTKRNAVWRTTRFAGPRGNGKNLRTV